MTVSRQKESRTMITSNRAGHLFRFIATATMILVLGISPQAHGARGLNALRGISSTKSGATTKIFLQLESKPTFTVYRLERPQRIIVDLANTTVEGYEDPVDIDSWAVGQVAVARFTHTGSTITRVLIGFKRQSSYTVEAGENRVVITVTANTEPPADLEQAKAKQARKEALAAEARANKAKQHVVKARKQTEQVRKEAQRAQKEAEEIRSRMIQAEEQLKAAELRAKNLDTASKTTAKNLTAMRSRLQSLRKEADRAQKELEESRKETTRLEERARSLKGTTEEARAEMRSARAQARQAQAERKAAEIEAEKAIATRRAARLSAEAALKERKAAQAEADRLRRLARKLKGTANEAQAKLRWAQAEANAARLEMDRTQREAQSLRSQVSRLRKEEQELKIKAERAGKRAAKLRTENARAEARAARALWEKKKEMAAAREAKRLNADLAKTRAEAENVRAELRRLRLEAEEAKKQAAQNKAEVSQTRALLNHLGERVESARGTALQAEAKAEKAAEKYSEIKNKTANARRAANKIQKELHRLEHRRQALRVETASLSRQVTEAKKQAAAARKLSQNMQNKFLSARKNVDQALEEVNKARARVQAIEKHRRALKGQSENIEDRFAKERIVRERALGEAQRRLEAERNALREVRQSRLSAEKARDGAIAALKDLEERKNRNIRLEKEALSQARRASKMQEAALTRARALEQKNAELTERHQRLLKASRSERAKHQELRKALVKLQTNVNQLRSALKEEMSRAEKARTAREREEMLARSARKARQNLQEHNRNLENQINRLKKLKETLSMERHQDQKALEQATAEQQKAERSRRQKREKQRAREIQELEREIALLRKRKDHAASTLNTVTREHASAQKLVRSLDNRLAEAQAALKRADREKTNAEKAVANARRQLEETLQRREKEQRFVQKLETERKAESKKLRELQERRNQVTAQMKGLKTKLEEERREMSELGRERTRVRKTIQKVHAELARLKKRKKGEEAESRRLEEKRKQIEKQLLQARAELKKTRASSKTAQRPNKKKTNVKREVTGEMALVNFRDTGETHRVELKVEGDFDYNIQKTGDNKVLLRLYGVKIPRKLEQRLDTSAFRGPVETVSAYQNDRNRNTADLLVTLKEPARFRINRKGEFLWVDFIKGSRERWRERLAEANSKAPTDAAVEVSASRVSGYRSRGTPQGRQNLGRRLDDAATNPLRGRDLGPRVDMDFKDADLHNVLRLIGQVWKKNIVVPDDVSGSVTIRMVNVRVGRALDVVLRSKNLGLVWEDANIIRVARVEDIQRERDRIREEEQKAREARIQQRESAPSVREIFRVSYTDVGELADKIRTILSPRGTIAVDSRTNTIIITDLQDRIESARDLTRTLDIPTPQVMIEARIVEARSSFMREVGVQWGGSVLASPATGVPTGLVFPYSVGASGGATDAMAPTSGLMGAGATNPAFAVNLPATVGTGQGGALGLSLGTLGNVANINLRLSAMEETGQVRIISSPKITTLDNVEAKIEQGVRIPISQVSAQGVNTIFEEASLGFTVTPHVTADGRVRLKLLVDKSEPDFVNTGARGDPTILKKQAQTEMLIPDGDTAVIGGIYTRTTAVAYSKVPWFADIPIIGWLFKKKTQSDDRSELLIFITPRIIKQGKVEERQAGR